VTPAIDAYGEIFEQRGHLYDRAMTASPHARDEEFTRVVAWADLRDGQVVCDVPSGPGDLGRYVDAAVTLIHVEASVAFARRCRARGSGSVLLGALESIPLAARSVDRVISLAALHHVADKRGVFREACRILKPGGVLCVADACSDSPVAEFLNGFVDAHSSLGHRGVFIGEATAGEIEESGLAVERSARVRFPWRFASRDEMAAFVQPLFGLDRATPALALAGIERHLGTRMEAEQCCLEWELRFIRAVKR
jgi:SAM-dependent methyltransferase